MKRVLGLTLLLACKDPFTPSGAVPIAVPPRIEAMWAGVEKCSGLYGDVHRLQWFKVEGEMTFRDDDGGGAFALWVADHYIYLSEIVADTSYQVSAVVGATAWREWVLRHEMLHDLTHDGSHGGLFDRCGLRTVPTTPQL